ncbi:solute carrier organic anion transporter family member 4C1-like isoform X2 [Ptychodera flava]|uniref:solute carrier organic anion transporter family member 4C1-like isoform X2 n=1 Tax=Ptychodera flava TaxID=63121 RepID=UPI003969E5E0
MTENGTAIDTNKENGDVVSDQSTKTEELNGTATAPVGQNSTETASVTESQGGTTTQAEEAPQETETEVSTLCGWFNIRPKWLQWFNTAPWLALTISLLMYVQGMVVSGFAYVSLTSIETRFQLPSVATGLILSIYDLTAVICLPIVSYFGASRNKPRWLAVGSVIMGFGFLLWTVPHFTSGYYTYGNVADGYQPLCRSEVNYTYYEVCQEEWTSLSYYFIAFAIAQVFVAIGASPIYNVGLAYVDENVSTKDSGWYVGVTHAFAVFGPVTGFLLGAVFLSIYTDISNWENVDLTPEDPAWVGAWWLGFLISWVLAWLVAIPVGAYPPELPSRKEIEKERQATAHQSEDDVMKTKKDFGMSWKDLGPATKYLLCNPAYMFVTLAQCSQNLLLAGLAPFMPKFLENQFALTSTQGAMIVGVTALPGAVGGTVLGGWIIRHFDLKVKGTLRFCITIALLTIALLPIFLMRCPEENIAGVTQPYNPFNTELTEVNLTHACNVDCHCPESFQYAPVCGANDLVYFDACYAGCEYTTDNENYYNCSCIHTNSSGHDNPDAVAGKCHVDCWQLPLYVILLFFTMLLGFTILTPYKYLTLRTVVDSQRSYALGVSGIFNKLFGSVPGPVLFGLIIDSSCVVWQITCETRGTCWIYDSYQFGLKFFVVGIIFMALTTFFFVMAYIFYKPPPDKDDDNPAEQTGDAPQMQIFPKTMSQDQLDATLHREKSEVSLIGYTRTDQTESNVI